MLGPSQPVWFDPKLFAGVTRFGGAIFTALLVPVVLVGLLVAGPLGAVTGVVLLVLATTLGADRFQAARARRRAATLAPRACPSCGEGTLSSRCPGCGAEVPDGATTT